MADALKKVEFESGLPPASSKPTAGPAMRQTPTIKPMAQPPTIPIFRLIFMTIIIILAGVGTGFVLSNRHQQVAYFAPGSSSSEQIKVDDMEGIKDEKTFRDEAEGVLVKGGIEGEGSHHLLRPGGPSQNVYMTSSVIDLDKYVNHKIKVWGETFAAQKAGWLMDVGLVKVLALNAPKPFEETANDDSL